MHQYMSSEKHSHSTAMAALSTLSLMLSLALSACGGGGSRGIEPLDPLPVTQATRASVVVTAADSSLVWADHLPNNGAVLSFRGSPHPLKAGHDAWNVVRGSDINTVVIQTESGEMVRFDYAEDAMFSTIRLAGFKIERIQSNRKTGTMDFSVTSPEGRVREYLNVEIEPSIMALSEHIAGVNGANGNKRTASMFGGSIRDIPKSDGCKADIDLEAPPQDVSECVDASMQHMLWGTGARFTTTLRFLRYVSEYLNERELAHAVRRLVPMQLATEARLLELSRQSWAAASDASTVVDEHYRRGTRLVLGRIGVSADDAKSIESVIGDLKLFEADPNSKKLATLSSDLVLRPSKAYRQEFDGQTGTASGLTACLSAQDAGCQILDKGLAKLTAEAKSVASINGGDSAAGHASAMEAAPVMQRAVYAQDGAQTPSRVAAPCPTNNSAACEGRAIELATALATCPAGYTKQTLVFYRGSRLPLRNMHYTSIPANQIDRMECWSGSNRATDRRTVIFFDPSYGYRVTRIERWKGFVLDGSQEDMDDDGEGTYTWRSAFLKEGRMNGAYTHGNENSGARDTEATFVDDKLAGPYTMVWNNARIRSFSVYQEIGGVPLSQVRYARNSEDVCYLGYAQVNMTDPDWGSCAR